MTNLHRQPRATLALAKNMIARLFMGGSTQAEVCASLNEAEANLNHAKWQRQMLASGQCANAIVRGVRDTGALVHFKHVIALDLDVHADGHPAWQVTVTLPLAKLALPHVNDVIEVRYNPENQQEVALVQ
jgi:hypothetical protein